MDAILTLIRREPALVVAIADAVIVLAVSFGLPIDPAQKAAIDALLALVGGAIVRSQVTPTASLPAK